MAEETPGIAADEKPIACPICLDHTVERIEGATLSANNMAGRRLGKARVYHCSHWHIFAVFEQSVTVR